MAIFSKLPSFPMHKMRVTDISTTCLKEVTTLVFLIFADEVISKCQLLTPEPYPGITFCLFQKAKQLLQVSAS